MIDHDPWPLVLLASEAGARAEVVADRLGQRKCRVIRGMVDARGERIRLPVGPVEATVTGLAADLVIELPRPQRDLTHGQLGRLTNGAMQCRPPVPLLDIATLRAADASSSWTTTRTASGPMLVRHRRHHGCVLVESVPDDDKDALVALAGLLELQPWAGGAAHVVRTLCTVDPAGGRVLLHPFALSWPLALLTVPSVSDLLAGFSANRAKPGQAVEPPGPAAGLTNRLAEALLDLPELSAVPGGDRLLPILACDVVVGDEAADAVVVDADWVSPGAEDAGGTQLVDAWLDCALARLPRLSRPLLDLPDGFHESSDVDVHPLRAVLPTLGGDSGVISVRPEPMAVLRHLNPNLRGPSGTADVRALTAHLACITEVAGDPPASARLRFVEPGVGRSYLLGGVYMESRPELRDFVVTGGGLTSYSAGGFVSIGQPINGRSALVRLEHRRYCGERLEALGCRTAPVVALFELPGERAPLPDGTDSASGLAVRGFRCVLRVRLLDPIASFYQSLQHSALIGPALLQRQPSGRGVGEADLLAALEFYAGGFDDVRRVLEPAPVRSPADQAARQLRRDLLCEYAPMPVAVARARLSCELGRDPDIEPVSEEEYVGWFAGEVGRQLALWRSARFLHDYHQPGVSRANGIMTLVESNVTLLAEFPDLDTALFIDSPEDADALQIDEADQAVLRAGFPEFHAREVDAARRIVRSLALAATGCDTTVADWAEWVLHRAYEADRR